MIQTILPTLTILTCQPNLTTLTLTKNIVQMCGVKAIFTFVSEFSLKKGRRPKFTFSTFTPDSNLQRPHIYTRPKFTQTQIYTRPIFTQPRFTQTHVRTYISPGSHSFGIINNITFFLVNLNCINNQNGFEGYLVQFLQLNQDPGM